MLDDAINALTQIFAPPLRALLWKSVALALALIVVVGIVLDRLILWLVGAGSTSIETTLGPQAHWPASALAWLLSVAGRGLGIIVGSVFLMPAVTAFVASFSSLSTRSPTKSSANTIPPTRPAKRCRCGARSSKAAGPRCWRSWST